MTPEVTLRLSANAAGLTAALQGVQARLGATGAAAEAAGRSATASFGRVRQGVTSISEQLANLQERFAMLAAAGAFVGSFAGVARMADEYTNLSSKIRLVTNSERELAAVRSSLVEVAQQTRQDLTATAELYTRLARSTADMGLSQQKLLGITTTINQAFVVSGASAAEASAAITQLSQGLASGVLRGEEFNSVAEQAPIIMDLLAKELNVTRGELRKMAEDGKLTADVLVNALGNGAASVAEQFAKMDLTIGQSFTVLRNALTEFVGSSAQTSGAAGLISGSIVVLANNLGLVANAVVAVAAVFATRFVASQLSAVAAMVGTRLAARAVAVEMGVTAAAATGATTAMTALRGAMALVGGPIGVAVLAVGGLAAAIYSVIEAEDQRRQAFKESIEATDSLASSTGRMVERLRDASAVMPPPLAQVLEQQTKATAELVKQQEALRAKREQVASLEARIQQQQASTREGAGVALITLIPQLEQARLEYEALEGAVTALKVGVDGLSSELESRLRPALDAARAAGQQFGQAVGAWDFSSAIGAIGQLSASLDLVDQLVDADAAAQAFAAALPKRMKDAQAQMAATGKSAVQLAQAWVDQGVAQAIAANQSAQTVEALRRQGAEYVAVVAQTERLKTAQQAATRAERDRNAAMDRGVRLSRDMRQEAEQYARKKSDAEAATADYVQSLREEVEQIGMSREALMRLNVMRELENRLKAQAADPAVAADRRAEVEAILAEGSAREAALRQQDEWMRQQQDMAQEYERTWVQASDAVAYAFGDFVSGSIDSFRELGQALKQIAQRMVADLVATFLRQRIVIPIQMAMAGNGGGLAGAAGQLAGVGGGGLGSILSALSPGALFGNAAFGAGTSLFGLGGSIGAFGGGLASAGANMLGSGFFGSMGANLSGAFASFGGGSLAAGLGQLLPVVGQIAAIAGLVNSLSGGKLFGTGWKAEGGFRDLSIGAGGAGGFDATVQTRQRSLFRGRQWREQRSDLPDDVQNAIDELFGAVGSGMQAAARALGVDVPDMIAGSFRQEFDKAGKLKREFSTIAGRVYEESQEAFGQRLLAENILATVGTRNGDASAIAERWRADAATLLDGSQFLLAAATDLRNGTALLTSGGLEAVTALVEDLAAESESLTDAYTRVRAATVLLEDALAMSGLTLDRSREDFVRFAADIAEAAGGLDRAQSLWSTYFGTFFSASERAEQALARARSGAASQFADIGLDAAAFAGEGGVVAFRQMFERVLPTLSADAVVEWLEAAEALSGVLAAQQAYNDTLAESARAAEEAAAAQRAAFEAAVSALRAAFDELSSAIAQLRGRIADDVQGLRAAAPGFDAVGFQRDRIASLRGQLAGATPAQQVSLMDQIRQATLARFEAESEQLRRVAEQQAQAAQAEAQRRDEAARAAEQAHAEAMRGWEAQIEAARRLRDFVDTLGLSNVSPLTAFQRFDEAQALYQRALAGGDAGALQQAAQAFLEETRNVYGVSDRAVGIFNEVRGALGARADQLASAAAPVFQAPALEAAVGGTSAAVVNVEAAIEALRAQAIADLEGLDGLLVGLRDAAEAQFQTELEALQAQYEQADVNTTLVVDSIGALNTDQAVRDAEALAVMREQLLATQAQVAAQTEQNVVMLRQFEQSEARLVEVLGVVRSETERVARAVEQGLRAGERR